MKRLILCALLVINFTSCKKESFYTETEIENLKKGDTIYFKEFRTIEKFIVIDNIKNRKLLEIKDTSGRWSVKQIEEYKNIQFQD